MPTHTTALQNIGDALIEFITPQVASLGLVSVGWAKTHKVEPSYPGKPRTDLPDLRLRGFTEDAKPGNPSGGELAGCKLTFSLWYRRLQVAGQNHQELLETALEVIASPFLLASFWPNQLEAVAGFQLHSMAIQKVIHQELEHTLGDPGLRVSPGEVNLTIIGRTRLLP